MYWMSHHLSSPSANQHRAFPFVILYLNQTREAGRFQNIFILMILNEWDIFDEKIDDLENFKKIEDRLEGQTYFLSSQNAEKCRKMTERVKIRVQRKLNCDFIKNSIGKNSPSGACPDNWSFLTECENISSGVTPIFEFDFFLNFPRSHGHFWIYGCYIRMTEKDRMSDRSIKDYFIGQSEMFIQNGPIFCMMLG